jgi:ribosome-associated toxin RatA of RatAB toxin-antitoxin module
MSSSLLGAAVGKLLDSVSSNLVEALCQRAKTEAIK